VATHRRHRTRRRTRSLAGAAGVASVALLGGELARVWRRGSAEAPHDASAALRGGRVAARETVAVVREGYRSGPIDETAFLNLFLACGTTLGAARATTHLIRRGIGPFGDVHVGRRHIHHFVPGILLAFAAGGASLGMRDPGVDRWLALPFGAGLALVLDESALLLELEDVYWSEEGVVSVQIAFGALAALATLALAVRLLRRGERAVLDSGEHAAAAPRMLSRCQS
jgi:hypothetical protein